MVFKSKVNKNRALFVKHLEKAQIRYPSLTELDRKDVINHLKSVYNQKNDK